MTTASEMSPCPLRVRRLTNAVTVQEQRTLCETPSIMRKRTPAPRYASEGGPRKMRRGDQSSSTALTADARTLGHTSPTLGPRQLNIQTWLAYKATSTVRSTLFSISRCSTWLYVAYTDRVLLILQYGRAIVVSYSLLLSCETS